MSRSALLPVLLLALRVGPVYLAALSDGALSPDPTAENVSLTTALDQSAAAVGRAVRSALIALTDEMDRRMEASQMKQDVWHERFDIRVGTELKGFHEAVDARTSAFEEQILNRIGSLHANVDHRLDELSGRLNEFRAEADASRLPRDCSDLSGDATSGIHLLQPGLDRSQPPVAAYCDLERDGGGWTVIQRRADISPREDFNRSWAAYREGFGELDAEFWWGLQPMHLLTAARDRQYELRFDLEDFDGARKYAVYQGFRVSSEDDGYRLRAVNYTGDAGDSIGEHTGMKFSTPDKDQDTFDDSCAQMFKAGWWFYGCHLSNPNGRYLAGKHDSFADGINWLTWRGYHYSLKTVTMKIRPTKKKQSMLSSDSADVLLSPSALTSIGF